MNQESRIQQSLMQWAAYASGSNPELGLLYSIPNGANTTIQNRKRLVCEGLKAGMPDLCLPVQRGDFSALYIELKTPKGRLSKVQEERIESLQTYGNMVVVCRGLEETIESINKYLSIKQVRG